MAQIVQRFFTFCIYGKSNYLLFYCFSTKPKINNASHAVTLQSEAHTALKKIKRIREPGPETFSLPWKVPVVAAQFVFSHVLNIK